MPEYFRDGNIPVATDKPTQSLQKINDLMTKPAIPGFAIPAYDTIALTYYGSTNNVHVVVYSKNSVTVATLTLSYVGGPPGSDDAILAGVVKS